jgi:hypothetical protein
MSPNVPWTSTTGYGRSVEGLHVQLFAPGGEMPGAASARATPVADSAATTTQATVLQILPFTYRGNYPLRSPR